MEARKYHQINKSNAGRNNKQNEPSVIFGSNAVIYPRAVMVVDGDAFVADLTMFRAFWFNDVAIRTDEMGVVADEKFQNVGPFIGNISGIFEPDKEESKEHYSNEYAE